MIQKAENIIFFYHQEVSALQEKRSLPRNSSLLTRSPFLDENGILRVGVRLKASALSISEKHPILLPGKHHIASILVRYFNERVQPQGRHFTEGAVRRAGFWITGGKRLISSLIFHCVTCTCRRLRTKCPLTKRLLITKILRSSPISKSLWVADGRVKRMFS